MDPQQELFTALLLQLKEAFPGKVYDGFLPPEDTPYPFVYLADSQLIETVYQTIDVWHSTPEKRGTVSAMLLQIKGICRKLEHTDNFAWLIHNIEQRILPDTSTGKPLLRGRLEVEFKFS